MEFKTIHEKNSEKGKQIIIHKQIPMFIINLIYYECGFLLVQLTVYPAYCTPVPNNYLVTLTWS